ncbi:MAG: hypothetical protein V1907_01830 [Candidatus Kerfeldbacteria bacterium]
MIDFAEVGRLNFREKAALVRLDAILGEVASYAETRTAAELASILQKKVDEDAVLAEPLASYIAKFRVLELPLLTDTDAISVFLHIRAILADERISLYERIRARFLIVPSSRREAFALQILDVVRKSDESFGSGTLSVGAETLPQTVGSWVRAFEASSSIKTGDVTVFFAQPFFKKLSDEDDHAVRHLIHIVSLLRAPDSIEAKPPVVIQRVTPTLKPVPAPSNLPVEPLPSAPASAAPPPVILAQRPRVSAPSVPFSPAPAAVSAERGPSVAAVLARLQQAQLYTPSSTPAVAHLTPEDHEEIRQHTDKLASYDVGPNVHDTLSNTTDAIIKDFNLTFADENLKRRFITIITSRLKDIRKPTDTLEILTRGVKVGGMEYDPELAEKIVMKATEEAQKFSTEEGVKKLVEKQQVVPATPKPPKVPIEPQPISPQPIPPMMAFPAPTPSTSMRVPLTTPNVPFRIPVQQVREAPTAPPQPAPPIPSASFRPIQTERPTISDIRGVSRLVGPVEEIRAMTLSDFRRLGETAVACVRKVYEKIQLLNKESFTKRAEGIKAWHESETYKLYLAMGQESLFTGKTIRDIIVERQRQGQPALSEQEFSLTADLNRKLRY